MRMPFDINLTRDEHIKFSLYCIERAEVLMSKVAALQYAVENGKTVSGEPVPVDVLRGEHSLESILEHTKAQRVSLLLVSDLLRGYNPEDGTFIIDDEELTIWKKAVQVREAILH